MLVQELPAVEGLARVDVVLLDKTGTITEGVMRFDTLEPHRRRSATTWSPTRSAALAADEHRNADDAGLCDAFPTPPGWTRTASTPFSSARKWSAATFGEHGTWVFGAPEMVWVGRPADDPVRSRFEQLASEGQRVLLLARTDAALVGETLPDGLDAAALVLFEERIRHDAADTLAYFADQGVRVQGHLGRQPAHRRRGRRRASASSTPIARSTAASFPTIPTRWARVLEDTAVFGRVTPHQKRAIVAALQQRGHVVAMTGDGVNDALALKDADIGVAMGSGAPATRAVAQIVLLDGQFAAMPGVVAEGRRVIANVERVVEPVRDQDGVRDAARDRGRRRAVAVSVPSAPPHDRQQPDDRHPGVLPRARAEPPALRAGLRAPRAALLDAGRDRSRPRRPSPATRSRARADGRVDRRGAHRGDDRALLRRALDPRAPGATVHARADHAARRDGRGVRGRA